VDFNKTITVEAPSETIADNKLKSLQSLAKNTDSETLAKISELMQAPGACAKFNKALNNPMVKVLF
jgi:hypothetical protein